MIPNRLFLERCDQMAILLESHKQIELLDLSAILRQLLFDKKSLVDTVNTESIKLEFRVGSWGEPPPIKLTMDSLQDGLDPESDPANIEVLTLSRDEFAKYPVTYYEGHQNFHQRT